eukprot:3079773-Prymnesium_polylepis.3
MPYRRHAHGLTGGIERLGLWRERCVRTGARLTREPSISACATLGDETCETQGSEPFHTNPAPLATAPPQGQPHAACTARASGFCASRRPPPP